MSKVDQEAKAKGRRAVAGSLADLSEEQRDAIRAAWARLSVKLPRELMSGGHWDVPEDDREALPDIGVPDGVYRVAGADYALAFIGGRLVGAAAAAGVPVDGYVEVPSR